MSARGDIQSQSAAGPDRVNQQSETLDLVRYWRAINRHRLGIALFVAAVGVLATVYAYGLAPVYRGTATVLLDPVKKKTVTNEELYADYFGTTRDYYLTQTEIMKSRDYAERLVRVLNLTRHPDYDPRQHREKGWIASLLETFREETAPTRQPTDEEIREGVVGQVMGQFSFQPVRNTQLVKLSFTSHDPMASERAPNTLAMIYIVADLEAKAADVRSTNAFLTAQADELKKKLTDSEARLQQYRESKKIVVTKGQSLSDATRRLEENTNALVEARRKRAAAELDYKQVRAAVDANGQSVVALESLAVVQKNPALLRLREIQLEAERKYNETSKRYGPEHPRMISAQADLKAARDAARRQVATIVQAVAKEYELAKANEARLEQVQNQLSAAAQQFNRAEFSLERLERDVASNRRLYEAFMQRAKEVRTGDMRQAIARVIDPAIMPKAPSGPNVRRIIGLAMLGALLFAVAIALLLERLDNKLRTSDDLEEKLDAKALGVLPRMKIGDKVVLERMLLDDNANTFSEAIRTVRSVVQLSTLDSPNNTVLVTSTVPGEGKTTIACNLALAFSQVKKTLLIEADMRKPEIRRRLGIEAGHAGLSEFVAGDMDITQCIVSLPGSTLSVLHSGRVPLNPLEMLSSLRFAGAMRTLQEAFEVIIIDSPPTQMVSDAMVLSRFATAVVYVVRADSTGYQLARRSIQRLRRIDAPVLGCVLNQFDVEKALKYYYDYSGMEAHYYRGYSYRSVESGNGRAVPLKAVKG